MGVQIDSTGLRWVEVSREVAGTVDEVWTAIATGPGVSAWFVPTDFTMGPNGEPERIVSHFGNDESMDSVAEVTLWEAPQRFVASSSDLGPDAPVVATEWGVKPLSGSTSEIYVRHSFRSESDTWDEHLEAWEGGWPWFFNVLGLYLLHFRGQPSAAYRVMGVAPLPTWDAWDDFAERIGLAESAVGTLVKAPDELPPLIGKVKFTSGEGQEFGAILRLDEPAPGILSAFAMAMDGQVYLVLDFFHYGKRATTAVQHWEPRWHGWMQENFGFDEDDEG